MLYMSLAPHDVQHASESEVRTVAIALSISSRVNGMGLSASRFETYVSPIAMMRCANTERVAFFKILDSVRKQPNCQDARRPTTTYKGTL